MGRIVSLMVTFALAAATTGCSGDSNSDEIVELSTTTTVASTSTSAPTTTEATTTTTSTQVEETTPTTTLEQLAAEIEADLQAGRDVVTLLAAAPSQADLGVLERWHLDPLLGELKSLIEANSEAGIAWRKGETGTNEIALESVSALGDSERVVVFCLSNDLDIYEASTGASLNDEPVSIRYSGRVVNQGGEWLLAEATSLSSYEGFQCAS